MEGREKWDRKRWKWRLWRGFQAFLGPKSQMPACIDIPICSCTGRGSVDDPLEDVESGNTKKNSSTDLDTGDQKYGCLSKQSGHV